MGTNFYEITPYLGIPIEPIGVNDLPEISDYFINDMVQCPIVFNSTTLGKIWETESIFSNIEMIQNVTVYSKLGHS